MELLHLTPVKNQAAKGLFVTTTTKSKAKRLELMSFNLIFSNANALSNILEKVKKKGFQNVKRKNFANLKL